MVNWIRRRPFAVVVTLLIFGLLVYVALVVFVFQLSEILAPSHPHWTIGRRAHAATDSSARAMNCPLVGARKGAVLVVCDGELRGAELAAVIPVPGASKAFGEGILMYIEIVARPSCSIVESAGSTLVAYKCLPHSGGVDLREFLVRRGHAIPSDAASGVHLLGRTETRRLEDAATQAWSEGSGGLSALRSDALNRKATLRAWLAAMITVIFAVGALLVQQGEARWGHEVYFEKTRQGVQQAMQALMASFRLWETSPAAELTCNKLCEAAEGLKARIEGAKGLALQELQQTTKILQDLERFVLQVRSIRQGCQRGNGSTSAAIQSLESIEREISQVFRIEASR